MSKMKIIASKTLKEFFTDEEILRLGDEQLLCIQEKKSEFCFLADVMVFFEKHGKEWAAFILYDKEDDDRECLLFCAREEVVQVLDQVHPQWREHFYHPDNTKWN